jgi:hypothetical protein
VLAALATHAILPPDPLPEGHPENKARERQQNAQRMKRAMYAASEADALIAELELREEYDPSAGPSIRELVAQGIAAGGHILRCKHGRASFEDCAECDAAAALHDASTLDETGKSGENGGDSPKPA